LSIFKSSIRATNLQKRFGLTIQMSQPFKSRSTWKDPYGSNVDEERFTIEFPIIFPLILIAIVMGFMAITTLQAQPDSRVFEVAQLSTNMLGYGMIVFVMVAIYPTKEGYLRFNVGFPEKETAMQTGFFVLVTFGVARAASAVTATTMSGIYNIPAQSAFEAGMLAPVVFTSAVYEEILHSLGVTTGLYIIIYKLVDRTTGSEGMARYTAIFLAPMLDGAFFAATHIGVYGTDLSFMSYLFVSRMVYGISYLYTRSAMVAFLPHVAHNLLMVWFGL
jgi:hypothetical protein